MARRGEFEQIASLFAPLTRGAPGALGLRDDAAVLAVPPGHEVVVTTDAIVAGVHYLPDDPPDLVARKLVRVNLSDLAAMGAEPLGLFAACAFPKDCPDAWVEAFARGLGQDGEAFDVPVLGGDTVATPGPAVFSLTALGTVPAGSALRRSGASVGDLVVVTGTLGDGAFGLLAAQGVLDGALESEAAAWLAGRYRLPQPRLALGAALRGIASAAMDISDGLLQDAGHVAAASDLLVEIDAASLPVSPAVAALRERPEWLATVAGGGDDYELLLAVPPSRWQAVEAAARPAGVAVTVVGRCREGSGVVLRGPDGAPIEGLGPGFRHF